MTGKVPATPEKLLGDAYAFLEPGKDLLLLFRRTIIQGVEAGEGLCRGIEGCELAGNVVLGIAALEVERHLIGRYQIQLAFAGKINVERLLSLEMERLTETTSNIGLNHIVTLLSPILEPTLKKRPWSMPKIDEAPASAIIIQTIDHQILEADGLMAVMLWLHGAQQLTEGSKEPRAEAYNATVRAEEILRLDGSGEHKVIVEVQNVLTHLWNIPEYSLYGV